MTGQSLAERICPRASGPCSQCVESADAVTAHLAAILSNPETVEAVAYQMFADECLTPDQSEFTADHWANLPLQDCLDWRNNARAAITVIAARLGVAL